jgi:ADP-ribosyl-[dinitrogen reductase] hydrolase
MNVTFEDRCTGSLLGLACGDAVGTTVEFSARGSFAPVTGMEGGGPFGLAPGQWTDDTSMALCLAESLIEKRGFDARDQMTRYTTWWRWGYLSSTGSCFDIGGTTQQALARFERTGEPYSGPTDRDSAGNGSIMRLAPVVLRFHPSLEEVLLYAAESSRTTHGAPEAIDCCRLLAYVIFRALDGHSKETLLDGAAPFLTQPAVRQVASVRYGSRKADSIRGSGYCVRSLEAALWCVYSTESFEAAILAAANLGEDADTTAAIAGQLAGALYGLQAIPEDWRRKVHLGEEIVAMARQLFAR